ncbi:unnamed protein product [Ilex paraguariensis]|uniref:Uncharacterized protein n=1 Tax=Ilex paraguariensis TaxID=185542 RepID=A0ABC8RZ23_9AQUA
MCHGEYVQERRRGRWCTGVKKRGERAIGGKAIGTSASSRAKRGRWSEGARERARWRWAPGCGCWLTLGFGGE